MTDGPAAVGEGLQGTGDRAASARFRRAIAAHGRPLAARGLAWPASGHGTQSPVASDQVREITEHLRGVVRPSSRGGQEPGLLSRELRDDAFPLAAVARAAMWSSVSAGDPMARIAVRCGVPRNVRISVAMS